MRTAIKDFGSQKQRSVIILASGKKCSTSLRVRRLISAMEHAAVCLLGLHKIPQRVINRTTKYTWRRRGTQCKPAVPSVVRWENTCLASDSNRIAPLGAAQPQIVPCPPDRQRVRSLS